MARSDRLSSKIASLPKYVLAMHRGDFLDYVIEMVDGNYGLVYVAERADGPIQSKKSDFR
jgi:hypothetical protein